MLTVAVKGKKNDLNHLIKKKLLCPKKRGWIIFETTWFQLNILAVVQGDKNHQPGKVMSGQGLLM